MRISSELAEQAESRAVIVVERDLFCLAVISSGTKHKAFSVSYFEQRRQLICPVFFAGAPHGLLVRYDRRSEPVCQDGQLVLDIVGLAGLPVA